MKNLLLLISVFCLLSCGTNTEKNEDFSQMTFSLDTVMVDSKGEILFLKWDLTNASISADAKKLYNFNSETFALEIINLESLQLEAINKFEKEGPNGIGNSIHGMIDLGNERIYMGAWPSPSIFDLDGRKIGGYENLASIKEKYLSAEEYFMYEVIDPKKEKTVYGLVNEFPGKNFQLGIIDLESDSLNTIPLNAFEKMTGFTITYDDGQMYDLMGPRSFLKVIGDKVFISSDISNELYWFDPNLDSLFYKSYQSRLTKNEKSGKHPNLVSDPKQFNALYRSIYGEPSFLAPVFDPMTELYYRFSYESTFEPETAEEDMYPKLKGAKVYLSVYDSSLNLLAEKEVPKMNKIPGFHFVKDGKIWIFENIDDDLAFVRLNIDTQ
ncbi:DUF4221 domain-containing protein [Aquiflexum gelatinilyticum]|uniref:DUF4221 domain-containing protein n=1 Tax=Aquiflexum gelatinilyticum TaxID=2961943 RepID=A0A9X2PAR0_9BACT|nr:DUF4221 domain-containing protein [Aquiflexum gelatinilyticum]MCR9016875.1 DUF4221 domain-containing protein [Aquiflexum gelatinilyticum]MCS4433729.1 DUF4221 domain-containing protein [Aquiflexum gelatinilyticum]